MGGGAPGPGCARIAASPARQRRGPGRFLPHRDTPQTEQLRGDGEPPKPNGGPPCPPVPEVAVLPGLDQCLPHPPSGGRWDAAAPTGIPRGWGGCSFPPPSCTPPSWCGSDVGVLSGPPRPGPVGPCEGRSRSAAHPGMPWTPPARARHPPVPPAAVTSGCGGGPCGPDPFGSPPPEPLPGCGLGGSFVRFRSSSGVREGPPKAPPLCSDPRSCSGGLRPGFVAPAVAGDGGGGDTSAVLMEPVRSLPSPRPLCGSAAAAGRAPCPPIAPPVPPRTSPAPPYTPYLSRRPRPPHPAGARPGGAAAVGQHCSPQIQVLMGRKAGKMQRGRVLAPEMQSGAWCGGAPGVSLPRSGWGPPAPPGCSKQERSGCFWRWPGLAVLGLAAGPGTGRVWERRWSCHLHPNRFHNPGEDGALLPLALPCPMGGSGEQEAEGLHVPSGASGVQGEGRSGSHALPPRILGCRRVWSEA